MLSPLQCGCLTGELCLQANQDVDSFLEQAADEAVGSNYGPAGGKFASKDIRVCVVFRSPQCLE